MDEFHILKNVCICHITSLSNNKFYKKQTWACLDIINEIHAPSPWHSIGSKLVPKCVHSHHTHVNEQDIGVKD